MSVSIGVPYLVIGIWCLAKQTMSQRAMTQEPCWQWTAEDFSVIFLPLTKRKVPLPCSRAEDCARSLTGFGMTDQVFVWLDHTLWWRQITHSTNQSRSKKQRRGMPRLYVEKCSREKYSRISTDETC